MVPLELLVKVGILPSVLYIGGWLCIGVLAVYALYRTAECLLLRLRKEKRRFR